MRTMRIKVSLALLLALMLFILTGCSHPSLAIQLQKQADLKKIEKPGVSREDKLYTATNTAGIHILRGISAENEGKNVIISPVSLAAILAVLQNGASGKTREEINAIINPERLPPEELNEKYCHTINHLNNAGYKENGNKTTLIEIANSLWIQEKFPVKDSFLKTANTYYGAGVYNVNFANDRAISAMNRWIENKTHGKIQNYVTSFNPPPAMAAFNSLYFNGKWRSPFDKSTTRKEDFQLHSGSAVRVDMMNAEKRIGYYEDDKIQAGRFDYYGCNMLVILPRGNTGEYARNLNYAEIQKAYSNLTDMKVKIKFPKFNYKQKNKLAEHLKALGMVSAFDGMNADFTGIADHSVVFNLYVDDISQECFISADENGTEAAALTSVVLLGSAPPKENVPPEFYLNRPFMYVISDDRTGWILFMGKVENPLG